MLWFNVDVKRKCEGRWKILIIILMVGYFSVYLSCLIKSFLYNFGAKKFEFF